VQLFLLKSVIAQAPRFDYDSAHLASATGQLMSSATISSLAIVLPGIPHLDYDLATWSPPWDNCLPGIELMTLAL